MIPRGKEPPHRIQDHELPINEELKMENMAVRVLVYTISKWIVGLDSVKVQLEWHTFMKTHG